MSAHDRPLPVVYLGGATPEQQSAFREALAAHADAGGVVVSPVCGAVDAVRGDLGPICTEPLNHDSDHIALDPATGLEVSRW